MESSCFLAPDFYFIAGGNERYRVARGGSWHETPDLCRSAVRLKLPYDEGDEFIEFRVAT